MSEKKDFTRAGGLVVGPGTASRSPPVEQIHSKSAEKKKKLSRREKEFGVEMSQVVSSDLWSHPTVEGSRLPPARRSA